MKIYQWTLQIGTADAVGVNPIFEELKFTDAKESGEEYFRLSLSSSLVFVGADFESIYGADIESKMTISLSVTEDNNSVWRWKGKFYKTDCSFNVDDQTCEVTPTTIDAYDDLLSGIKKEYDLTKIGTPKAEVQYDKRTMLQFYIKGMDTLTCVARGLSWEQDCEAIESSADLYSKYFFSSCHWSVAIEVGGGYDEMPKNFLWSNPPTIITTGTYTLTNSGCTLVIDVFTVSSKGGYVVNFNLKYPGQSAEWSYTMSEVTSMSEIFNAAFDFNRVHAQADATYASQEVVIYARLLCDVPSYTIAGTTTNTNRLSSDDMAGVNKNFRYAIRYSMDSEISSITDKTTEITPYYYKGDEYYVEVAPSYGYAVPILQKYWGIAAYWLFAPTWADQLDTAARKTITLKDAYPLWGVIKALCAKITAESDYPIKFSGTSDYSEFLYGYGQSYVTTDVGYYRLYITQKTNILTAEYTQAAQKAPVTLRKVLDMLRDCFQCYWWIEEVDGEYRLRIEHKIYFVNGGGYDGSKSVGLDLTSMECLPIGGSWAFGANEFSYDKDDMPEQYEFGWSDDVTDFFDGNPIEIRSKFVKEGNVKSIKIDGFVSDIDYMLFEPSSFGSDGFALLACDLNDPPMVKYWTSPYNLTYQNAYVSFYKLAYLYRWSMPAENITINDVKTQAIAVERRKVQTIECPFTEVLDNKKLVRTEIGDGDIESIEYDVDNLICSMKLLHETK